MGFTFTKSLLWILLAGVLGVIIGWFANGWRKRASVTDVDTSTSSNTEVDRLRNRVANLEPAVEERESLRRRVTELEASLKACEADKVSLSAAGTAGVASLASTGHLDVPDVDVPAVDVPDVGLPAVDVPEVHVPEVDVPDVEVPEVATGGEVAAGGAVAAGLLGRFHGVQHDFGAAQGILGKSIKLDDLKVVEGIGPKIEELIHGGGVNTWAGLADTPVSRLQEILDAAGERYRIHKPDSWPRQAELLAQGKWAEFKQLTDDLTAGR